MLATALALPLLSPASALVQEGQGQGPIEPIQVQGDHYIITFSEGASPDDTMNLADFISACEQATGRNFTYIDETHEMLKNAKIRLLGQKIVPKEEFYSFFQIMMIINDFVCSQVGPDHLAVILVESLKTQARATVKLKAVHVDPEDLDLYEDQPAVLITTVIHMPNTDVRQLSNSMRTMLTDANTQQMLPAGNTNSMVLTGFGSSVAAMARMLRLVDEASKTDIVLPEFEVIPLEYAGADEIASTIEELLDASTRAAQGLAQQNPAAAGATGQLVRGRTETKIMVDPRTNSLLVMAMPDDMPRIKELVARLDVEVIERGQQYHIYNLENVDAQELSDTLEEFLDTASRLDVATPGQPGQQRPAAATTGRRSNEFVVVPDPQTNSLLIAASHTRYQELLSLVQRLDQRQDQVLIETALVELSARDFLDVGVELGFADVPATDDYGGFGITDFNLSSLQDTDGDGLLDTRIPTFATGITAGILDGDDFSLPFLIRLLQERRNTNVLNVPSVLVNNNGTAIVETLDEQPTTQITATGGVGGQTQENFAEYVDAGITMRISPSISARNYLRLGVYLQVSNFLGTVQGAIPPPRITRTLETQVNVPDGDTMVIGGLIIDNSTETRTQVPLLGDIPILGRLFRRDSSTEDRTALYFFVTPHIMRDLKFADLAEVSYQKKLEAAETIGTTRIRQIDRAFGRQRDVTDLSGFDVPLYTSPARGEVDPSEVGLDDPERRNELLEGAEEEEE